MITTLLQTVQSSITLSTSGTGALAKLGKGSLIVVAVGFPNNTTTVTSITDTLGNSYAKATSSAVTLGVELWYAYVVNGGAATTVTVNISPSGSADFTLREYSFMASTPLDQVNTGNGSSATPTTTATATTTQAQELVVAAMTYASGAGVGSAGAGFGNYNNSTITAGLQLGLEDKTVLSTATYTGGFNITISGSYDTVIATFNVALGPSFRPSTLRPHPFSPGLAR